MDQYDISLTQVHAPLVVIQGISKTLRPGISNNENKNSTDSSLYGLEITIERQLDDIQSIYVERFVKILQQYNNRGKYWWSGTNGSNTISNGMWFNIKYVEQNCQIVVNGSGSQLSPYNSNSQYYGSLLPLEWIKKYVEYLPSVFITVYEIKKDDKLDALMIDEISRIKSRFKNSNIEYIVLLIKQESIDKLDELRMSELISKITSGGKTSLYIMNEGNDEDSIREQNIFCKKLLFKIRKYSNDFFDLKINKLKEKPIKDDQYLENFFKTRNLIKMTLFEQFKNINDYSTKLLEYSYDKLLSILKSLDESSYPLPYRQICQWLDIICLHIVRACIKLHDYNVSYRKFMFHLEKLPLINNRIFNTTWISNQYKWFGELIKYSNDENLIIEGSMLSSNNPILKGKNIVKNSIIFNSFNLPQNGFIFLEAFQYRKLAEMKGEATINDKKTLLNWSLDSFNKAKDGKFNRIESFIYIMLGDLYYSEKNYSMAVNNYNSVLSIYRLEKWKLLIREILIKILKCYIELSRVNEAKKVFIELICVYDNDDEKFKEFLKESRDKIDSLELIEDDSQSIIVKEADDVDDEDEREVFIKEKIFNVDAVVKKYQNLMKDGVDVQIVIEKISKVEELEITKLEVDIGEIGNEEVDIKKVIKNKDDHFIFNKGRLIITMNIPFKQIGKFYISHIKINGIVNSIKFNTNTNIDVSKYERYVTWYDENGQNESILCHNPRNEFRIIPRIPKIKVVLKYDNVTYNGRNCPIDILFENEDVNEGEDVEIDVIGYAMIRDKKFSIECDQSDDEEDKVLKIGCKKLMNWNVKIPQIRNLKRDINKTEECYINFEISYKLINEFNVRVSTEREARIKILEMLDWNSEIRVENINKDGNLQDKRVWNIKSSVKNLTFEDLHIKNLRFKVKGSKEVEVVIHCDDEKGKLEEFKKFKVEESKIIESKLEVKSINGFIGEVPILVECNIIYEDIKGNEEIYIAEVFNGIIRIGEPRVIVDLIDNNEEIVKILYKVENPSENTIICQTNHSKIDGMMMNEYIKNGTFKVNSGKYFNIQQEYNISKCIVKIDIRLPEFAIYDKINGILMRIWSCNNKLKIEDGRIVKFQNI